MAFHTYLAHVVSKAKDKPLSFSAESSMVRRVAPMNSHLLSKDEEEEKKLTGAKRLNCIGKSSFAIFMIVFNLVFWIVAINEYLKPAEDYIK
jgi:hypothetical protein